MMSPGLTVDAGGPRVGGTTPGQVVLNCITNQAERVMEEQAREQCSSVSGPASKSLS